MYEPLGYLTIATPPKPMPAPQLPDWDRVVERDYPYERCVYAVSTHVIFLPTLVRPSRRATSLTSTRRTP
eukprot:9054762-Pyramimonas_sp.AAC.1